MADINNLSNLQSTEPIDWDHYADSKESPRPPRKGRYQLQAPPTFTFSPTRENYLQAQIDPTVIAPSDSGFVVKFARVSAKTFKRGGVTVSQLGDYLRATGVNARPQTPDDQINAVNMTAGRQFVADLDWEAYCKGCKFTLKGMENFPSDGKGGHQPVVACPTCKVSAPDPEDPSKTIEVPLNLRANVKIDRFVAQQS